MRKQAPLVSPSGHACLKHGIYTIHKYAMKLNYSNNE